MNLLEKLLPKFGNHKLILANSVKAYLDAFPEQRQAMFTSLKSQDRDAFGQAAHRIKGSVGFFAGPDLTAKCQELETLSSQAPFEELASSLERTDKELQAFKNELIELLAELGEVS